MILKPFQQVGAEFLAARSRALLADEPGVGKTAQFITAANLIGAQRVGIVCPEIGIEHWRREIVRWGLQAEADIIGWGEAHKWAERLGKINPTLKRWDVLIPDECHFGKNPHARRTHSVFAKGGLAWHARSIWCGSGTPAPNNLAELWPMLRAFGKIGMDLDSFTRYFCVVDDMGKIRGNRSEHIEELRAILKTFTLRRLKRDVLPELGEIDIQEWYVKPKSDFVIGYIKDYEGYEEALRRELQGKSDEDILIFLAGDREFSTLRRYNALLKAPVVFETVKFELENGLLDKVVIYGYHKEALAAMEIAFFKAKIPVALIYGDTPARERDGLIEQWKRSGVVLLASIMVAGTAIDLTAAHQGIMIEMSWVPSDGAQAMQRMHRLGQKNPVTVRVAIGTPIDEIVSDVLLRKTRDIAELFGEERK